MNWKQQAIEACEQKQTALEETQQQQVARREAQLRKNLSQWLKDWWGIDAEVTSNRYTIEDGYTFVVRDEGVSKAVEVAPGYKQRPTWYSIRLEGECPECGRIMLSPTFRDKSELGGLLKQFRAEWHECIAKDEEL